MPLLFGARLCKPADLCADAVRTRPCSKWLARHEQDYIVTLGHVECIDDLKAYKASLNRKMAKRSREQLHAAVARRTLQERASPTYFTMCAAMLVILDARAAY